MDGGRGAHDKSHFHVYKTDRRVQQRTATGKRIAPHAPRGRYLICDYSTCVEKSPKTIMCVAQYYIPIGRVPRCDRYGSTRRQWTSQSTAVFACVCERPLRTLTQRPRRNLFRSSTLLVTVDRFMTGENIATEIPHQCCCRVDGTLSV